MNHWLIFGAGVLARLVSVAAELYSDWLLAKLRDGGRAMHNFVDDLFAFGEWVISLLAHRWAGSPEPYTLY